MAYVRISLMQAKHGREAEVKELLSDLAQYFAGRPGNLASYVLEHDKEPHRHGRVTIWESEEAAEQAAVSSHDMAVRSQLIAAVEENSHEELSFEGTQASA